MTVKTVGLFGTCGDSKWREDIAIPALEAAGVDYFNPVVKDWNEEAMKNEAFHAANDQVILLVITGETTGIASMAESGWIALQCFLTNRQFVLVLEDVPDEDPALRINKTRKLIRTHIGNLVGSPVKVYASITEGVAAAIQIIENK